ncbi:efflux RND transporter periplasmic adaptor subunit [Candidatus Magnetaquicoccus inordinatus]|uniref:efflux RND transporter periplasmic adaptor subunit n=1 Tax=Candidatus Magnetaquicoccus inordinatus TaxID=2496818 RepID=UPI001D0E6150|nr:HlyD family efflux transporter periplasmic adaptor subunit [Candidatus Magnetaquicoccus inordinatus]
MSMPAAEFSMALPLLLALAQRARQAASLQELRFIMVNESHSLFPYRQAMLWDQEGKVVTLSGIAQAEAHAPFVLWLQGLLRERLAGLSEPCVLLPDDHDASLQQEWLEWLPPFLLLLPLTTPDRRLLAVLGLARDEPWRPEEVQLLQEVAGSYALSVAWWQHPSCWAKLGSTFWRPFARRGWLLVPLLMLLAFVPIRLSVLAPAELVARDPAVIRAPLDGIIDRVLVTPNQSVGEGELLIEMETSNARSKVEVARRALSTARSEYERSAQQGFSDGKAKAQLGVIAGRIEERQAELLLLADLLQRSRVKAPRSGRVVMDDPAEWVGRAVTVGEKLIAIADEQDTELEAWLAPEDRIPLPEAAALTLFLNVDPLHPLHARLRYITYEVLPRADGTLAYRLRAELTSSTQQQRLGLKGTVRIDGEPVAFAYWLLRRPLALIRQFLGV